jgi:hypothetical protein
MLPFAVAALNCHSECFKGWLEIQLIFLNYLILILFLKELESVLETIESRREHFETRDDFGRTFLHLAALAG